MRITRSIPWLVGAGLIWGVATALGSADLAFFAAIPGIIGIGMIVVALKASSIENAIQDDTKIRELEERLRLTEGQLANTTKELDALKARLPRYEERAP